MNLESKNLIDLSEQTLSDVVTSQRLIGIIRKELIIFLDYRKRSIKGNGQVSN